MDTERLKGSLTNSTMADRPENKATNVSMLPSLMRQWTKTTKKWPVSDRIGNLLHVTMKMSVKTGFSVKLIEASTKTVYIEVHRADPFEESDVAYITDVIQRILNKGVNILKEHHIPTLEESGAVEENE